MRALSGAPLLLVLVCLGACSASPIERWQQSVERRVIDQGGGDFGVLRYAGIEGNRVDDIGRRAGLLEMFPSNRRDVHGVLLPPQQVRGQAWQPILVGVVRYTGMLDRFPLGRSRVEDIRLALTRVAGDSLDWVLSEADPQTLATYLGTQGDETSEFPRPRDAFAIEVSDDEVRVIERTSGASWRVRPDGTQRSSTDQ